MKVPLQSRQNHMTVAIKNDNKMPLVVPRAVRRTAGFKLPNADDEYTPEQRQLIDAGLKEAAEEVKQAARLDHSTPPMK
jgi:hypothetical protein